MGPRSCLAQISRPRNQLNQFKMMEGEDVLDAEASTVEENISQISKPQKIVQSGKTSQTNAPQTNEEGGRSDILIWKDIVDSDVYTYKSGIAVIINIIEFDTEGLPDRKGSDIDASSLYQRFQELGFESDLLNDATYDEIEEKFNEIKEDKDMLETTDCLVVALLTHGTDEDTIYTRDRKTKLKNIMEQFNTTNCPELALKPKIFIVQACRGPADAISRGVEYKIIRDQDPNQADARGDDREYKKVIAKVVGTIRIPNEADFLAVYATSQGYGAFRNSKKGSPFVRILSDELLKMDKGDDLYTVLTRVNRKVGTQYKPNILTVKNATQMPCFVSHLTKQLFLKA